MALQYDRQYELTIQNDVEQLVITGLRLRFELTKTLLGYPNRGRLSVINLSEENIQRITQRFSTVELRVAYGNVLKTVFRSNLLNYYKSREGVDSVFNMVTSGAARQWRADFFNRSYVAGTPPGRIIGDVAASFGGVTVGQILESDTWKPSLSGATYSGSSNRVMNQLARTFNFDWSVDEDLLNVVPRGQVLPTPGLRLITPRTGLLGSPTITDLGADFRILLDPEVRPGYELQMDSAFAQLGQEGIDFRRVRNTADGRYKVMDARMVGDTRGDDWYVDIIGWRIGDEPRKDTD